MIYVTNNKQELIKKKSNELIAHKYYSLSEFLNSFYLFSNKTIEYIMDYANVNLEIAKIYLNNIIMYPIDNDDDDPKCQFLSELKHTLIQNKLLFDNTLFINYLKRNSICFYNISPTKLLLQKTKDFPNITWYQEEQKIFLPKIFELETLEDEIQFVGEKIIELIHQGVDINHIYITNLSEEYIIPIKRNFQLMHIPLELKTKTKINETILGSTFIKNIDNIDCALELTKEKIVDSKDEDIYNQIVSIVNKYNYLKRKKDFITAELKHTSIKSNKKKNAIHEVSLNQSFTEEDYVFILSFNSNTIPITYKDEDYLNDKIKQKLNLDTTTDKNIAEKEKVIAQIQNIANCIITYKKKSEKDVYPSSLIEEMNLKVEKGQLTYQVSHEFNQYKLGIFLDNFTTYGTIHDDFLLLYSNYQIPYRTYQNHFTKINQNKLLSRITPLNLSYTKLDLFHKCSFAYYLNYVLKIALFEENWFTKIGTILHKVLEEMNHDDFDFDFIFENETKKQVWNPKEKFFLTKIKAEFRFIIDTLLERNHFSKLNNHISEHEIKRKIPNKIETYFQGKIDKISYCKINGKQIYTITDYKTGFLELDPSIMPHGFSLQLPTYYYLISEEESFQDGILGGFYLQPILLGKTKHDPKINIDVLKMKALKMVGYSNKDVSVLENVDSSFEDSNCIASLKRKNDGEFYSFYKIYDENDLSTLKELVDTIIKKDVEQITEGHFIINPKILDNKENISCKFCPFSSICFHTAKENIYIESDKTFLKKEVQNGLDERTRNSDL